MKFYYVRLNFFDKILVKVLKNYTQKIYMEGTMRGYNWAKGFTKKMNKKLINNRSFFMYKSIDINSFL